MTKYNSHIKANIVYKGNKNIIIKDDFDEYCYNYKTHNKFHAMKLVQPLTMYSYIYNK